VLLFKGLKRLSVLHNKDRVAKDGGMTIVFDKGNNADKNLEKFIQDLVFTLWVRLNLMIIVFIAHYRCYFVL
jgi:ubiquinone/menaquinone biosynthesis C-methylase UbiE